jgi:hypothetical protein
MIERPQAGGETLVDPYSIVLLTISSLPIFEDLVINFGY